MVVKRLVLVIIAGWLVVTAAVSFVHRYGNMTAMASHMQLTQLAVISYMSTSYPSY